MSHDTYMNSYYDDHIIITINKQVVVIISTEAISCVLIYTNI